MSRLLKYTEPPMRGDDVTRVIAIVRAHGFYRGSAKLSYMKAVAGAVADFQMSRLGPDGTFLTVDGKVGPDTRWAMANPTGKAQMSGIIIEPPVLAVADTDTVLARFRLMAEALKWHNVKERPDGSNRGPKVDQLVPGWAKPPIGNGYPWCCFSQWQFYENVFGEWPLGDDQHRGGVASAYRLAREKRRWITNRPGTDLVPTPGDLGVILYKVNGSFTGKGHIFLILSNSKNGSDVYTVGGNEANRVKLARRSRLQANFAGWIDLFGDSRTEAGKPWTFQDYPADDSARLTVAGTR